MESDSGAAAPKPDDALDPRQRFEVEVATWFADTETGESRTPTGGGPATFRLKPVAMYGRQPDAGDVLMSARTQGLSVDCPHGAPFWDVRIERGTLDLGFAAILAMPGLIGIDFYPPASGPEVELTFGTAEGAEAADEHTMRNEVARITGHPVLAIRQRQS